MKNKITVGSTLKPSLTDTSQSAIKGPFANLQFSCTIVNMNIIADTNAYLAVALNQPEKDRIITLSANCELFSPEILPYELGNALSAMVKRKQLDADEALAALQVARAIPVKLVSADIQKSLELASSFNIYAYDAYFLQSALSLGYPLLTLDKGMQYVARQLSITILE